MLNGFSWKSFESFCNVENRKTIIFLRSYARKQTSICIVSQSKQSNCGTLVSASEGTPTDRPQLDYDRLILHTKLASIFSIWQALI